MRSGWSALSLALALGACAQDVDDLPVPRAWSYGTTEVAVVESPAGAPSPAAAATAAPAAEPVKKAEPGSIDGSEKRAKTYGSSRALRPSPAEAYRGLSTGMTRPARPYRGS